VAATAVAINSHTRRYELTTSVVMKS